MRLFARRPPFDRRRLLAEAERARQKGRLRRALDGYRRVLAAERNNAELHARIAPLLARTGQAFDAWQSYRHAAQVLAQSKQHAQALALYRDATRMLPREFEAWRALAALQVAVGRRQEARDTLLEGRRRLGSGRLRAQAIALLRDALALAPDDPALCLDLVSLLSRSGQGHEALWLLDGLAQRSTDRSLLRRVRAAQWRIEPSLEHAWLWLRACLGAGRAQDRQLPTRGLR